MPLLMPFVMMGLAVQLIARRLRHVFSGAGGALAIAVLLGVTGLGTLGTALAFQKTPPQPRLTAATAPPPAKSDEAKVYGRSIPLSLSIPAIDVTSELIQVGKNPDGTLETPSAAQYNMAAWYRDSPTPGQPGASVIEGHIDHYETGASVFYRLGELVPGDIIEVERTDNSTVRFKVTAVESFDKAYFPTDKVYTSPGNAPELRLITCGGEFDPSTGDYERNTVVSAALAS